MGPGGSLWPMAVAPVPDPIEDEIAALLAEPDFAARLAERRRRRARGEAEPAGTTAEARRIVGLPAEDEDEQT
jgi:hypothetical protein